MRLLICAGGTGGGVYPALAVLQTLAKDAQPVLWIGNQAGMDADLVQRAGIPFMGIPSAGIHGVGLRSLPGNIYQLVKGYFASRNIIKDFHPDVILFTGGFVAVPVATASRKIPSLLYVPDIEPGLALKFLAYFATSIAVTAEDSHVYLPRRILPVVTGYPIRPELSKWERNESRKKFGLKNDKLVLLVFGGSKGAQSINQALLEILPNILNNTQVIHISGSNNWKEVEDFRNRLSKELAANYHVFPYLHEEMGAALAAADLVVSRAGASTLGEFPHFSLPAILIPYPFAWRYQKVNANYLASRGAAVVLDNDELKEKLLIVIQEILNQPERLESMRLAMRSLDHPQAANQLADLIIQLAHQSPRTKGVPA